MLSNYQKGARQYVLLFIAVTAISIVAVPYFMLLNLPEAIANGFLIFTGISFTLSHLVTSDSIKTGIYGVRNSPYIELLPYVAMLVGIINLNLYSAHATKMGTLPSSSTFSLVITICVIIGLMITPKIARKYHETYVKNRLDTTMAHMKNNGIQCRSISYAAYSTIKGQNAKHAIQYFNNAVKVMDATIKLRDLEKSITQPKSRKEETF